MAKTQLELMEEIRDKANINIVTCGSCGTVVLHERVAFDGTNDEEIDIQCYDCGFKSEPCDFPDLFYRGWDDYLKDWIWNYSLPDHYGLKHLIPDGEIQAETAEEAHKLGLEEVKKKLKSLDIEIDNIFIRLTRKEKI
jgi:hypothetical protein